MERRKFLLSVCGAGAAVVALNSGGRALPAARTGRSRIVNRTDQSIFLKIVGPFPDEDSHPDRGGNLFPEEEYFADLGKGKRIVIAWDHIGEKILTMKEVGVFAPSQIEIHEGNVFVTTEM
jgi:hypothetical protein